MITRMHVTTFDAALRREIAEHRLNRFLHVHVSLCVGVSLLPLFTPDAAARSAPAWVLQAVLFCLSLSSLLLGLSAAHGDADEFPMLFTQPVSRAAWLAGKVISAVVFALLGLAVGFWVRDQVRGLLLALGVWFALLFGLDLVLLAVSGAPWVQAHGDAWVVPLMVNPLSALRVTLLFGFEQTAPASVGASPLVRWWLANGGLWLTAMLSAWMLAAFGAGLLGAHRRLDS